MIRYLKHSEVGKHEEHLLRDIVNKSLNNGRGEIGGVFDASGIIVTARFYLLTLVWLIFLICGSTTDYTEKNAMRLLVDEQIKCIAGNYIWYGFSGSNIVALTYFNSSFGTRSDIYYSVSINRLSFLMKLITHKFE